MILCCPEDKYCEKRIINDRGHPGFCCSECQLPVCNECLTVMQANGDHLALPPAALANDLMIYYAPRELYEHKVTMLEMVCASVCITSMICFTLEKKFRNEKPLDAEIGMNRHHMGARGNATSFPLPWQDLVRQFENEMSEDQKKRSSLPRTGEELSIFVSVILKTRKDEDVDSKSLAKFIHQAIVRRDVVVDLIRKAKERGLSLIHI